MSHVQNDRVIDQMREAVEAMNVIEAAYIFLPLEKRVELDNFLNYIGNEINKANFLLNDEHLLVKTLLLNLHHYIYKHVQE